MARVPKRVSERLAREVRRFQRVLRTAADRDVNESDTVAIVRDILGRVFGFEKYTEITEEFAIRGTYCDLAIKVDGQVKYLIEVKAIGLGLKESHLRQAIAYGAQHGIQWVVLTNGIEWQVYRIRFKKPLSHDLVVSYDFLELSPRKREDQALLFILCKEALGRAVIEEFHQHARSVNRFVIGAILETDPALDLVRREIRRLSPGVKVERDEIKAVVLSDVLKRDVIEGELADEARARVKKAARRSLRKRKAKAD